MNSSLWIGVVTVSGTAIGIVTGWPPSDAAALGITAISVAVVVRAGHARRALLVLAAWLACVAYGSARAHAVIDAPVRSLAHAGAPDVALVRGTLAEDAVIFEDGVGLTIAVESIDRRPIAGRLQLRVSGELAARCVGEWTAGRRIAAPALLREPATWRNPGSASERWQRLRQRADLVGTIKSAALVEVEPAGVWQEAAARTRRHVRAAAARHVAPASPQGAAVVTAILIGDRAGLADDVQDRLRAAGTYHVVAISGGNVAILAALCFGVLGLLLRSFRGVAGVTLAIVLFYGALVGDEPSVRRAVTAASMYLTLSVMGLNPRALHILSVTAAALTVADPLIVIDAGAWLSFGATVGILVGARAFVAWATAPPDAVAPPARDAALSRARRAWLGVLGLLAATVAAELTLLPISAALFARVGLLGLVLNFVAIPAMAVVQLAGIAMTASAGWWDGAAAALGRLAALAGSVLLESSRAVDAAPWLVWRVPPVSPVWTALCYTALVAAVVLRPRTSARRLAIVTVAISAAVIVTAPGLSMSGPRGGVQFPDGHSLLIDAGGAPGSTFDIGDRIVTPALWALGIRRLDWLAITHADVDHAGGVSSVARNFRPREIWEAVPVPSHRGLHSFREDAHQARRAWRQMLAGHRIELGGAVLEAVHPPAPDWERRRVRNDDSLVLRIQFGSIDLLLTGDAGSEFEDAFVDREPRALLRLLKVGHHGSRTSTSDRFVDAFAPHLALISAGRGNTFGHPTRDVLTRLDERGAIVLRTDLDGAITIETDGATIDARTMSGRHWTLSAH